MQVLCLIWGIFAVIGMVIAILPLLGWLNWINIPFSVIGLILSIIATATGKQGSRNSSIAGIVCCAIAVLIGLVRLVLGGGIL
jgi:hypothetical protein